MQKKSSSFFSITSSNNELLAQKSTTVQKQHNEKESSKIDIIAHIHRSNTATARQRNDIEAALVDDIFEEDIEEEHYTARIGRLKGSKGLMRSETQLKAIVSVHRWQFLEDVFSTDIFAFEAKWSIFVAAVLHASCANVQLQPFPSQLYPAKTRAMRSAQCKKLALLVKSTTCMPNLLYLLQSYNFQKINHQVLQIFYWLMINKFSPYLRTLHDDNYEELVKLLYEDNLQQLPTHIFEICYVADENAPDMDFKRQAKKHNNNIRKTFYGCQFNELYDVLYNGVKRRNSTKNASMISSFKLYTSVQACLQHTPKSHNPWRNSIINETVQIVLLCAFICKDKAEHLPRKSNDSQIMQREKSRILPRYILVFEAKDENFQQRVKCMPTGKLNKDLEKQKLQLKKLKRQFKQTDNHSAQLVVTTPRHAAKLTCLRTLAKISKNNNKSLKFTKSATKVSSIKTRTGTKARPSSAVAYASHDDATRRLKSPYKKATAQKLSKTRIINMKNHNKKESFKNAKDKRTLHSAAKVTAEIAQSKLKAQKKDFAVFEQRMLSALCETRKAIKFVTIENSQEDASQKILVYEDAVKAAAGVEQVKPTKVTIADSPTDATMKMLIYELSE